MRMKWTAWLCGFLAAAVIACGGDRRSDSNTTGGAGSETGTMEGGTGTTMDTTGAATTDTAHTGAHSDSAAARTGVSGTSDSARGNQTKSGVTNTETGKSTLGPGVTKTRPDQNQPVTSKGDTVGTSPDSSTGSNR
jgi:hypothetical protein